MKKIVFFNNKGGVGKTTLVYHFSFMLAEMGYKVLSVDLDPQMNLTGMFLPDERLEEVFNRDDRPTIYSALLPLIEGTGDIDPAHIEPVGDTLHLLIGDLGLSTFEDKLSDNWGKCVDEDLSAFRIVSAFNRIIERAGRDISADIVVIDVGPNLGAINRSTLIASDFLAMPVASDLFSLQGMKNLGATLARWKREWKKRYDVFKEISSSGRMKDLVMPEGNVQPIGYLVVQHSTRDGRPVKAYRKWAERIPTAFREYVLQEPPPFNPPEIDEDPHCLGMLKHYRSLMPMAMEVRKPIFRLMPADGAIGAHFQAVRDMHSEFRQLTATILEHCR